MSMVGASEQEPTRNKVAYAVGVARLRETAHGQIMGPGDGLLKRLFGLEDRRVVGVHYSVRARPNGSISAKRTGRPAGY